MRIGSIHSAPFVPRTIGRALRVAVVTAMVFTGFSVTGTSAALAQRPEPAGTVHPVPQDVQPRDDGFPITPVVGLVRAADSDQFAEQVVRSVLDRADVQRVVTTDGADPGTPVTIWLGNGDGVLADLEVEPVDPAVAESYVLAAGRDGDDRGHIVLDGADTDGTFYAAQTLRQLVQDRTGRDWMPGVEVRDWPAMAYRGLIEGFYGTPWSHEDRLALMDHLGEHKMNTFEYAPKDDPFHRQRWRDPYPPEQLAQLGELIDRAVANHVDFTFALSPGLSICYSSQQDFEALIAKFESIYAAGGRSFNIPLDDINYNDWHCQADIDRFGTGGGAAGRAQAYLLNRVQREWVEAKGDVAPLQMVPTEYYNTTETPYKRALREELDTDVVVMWTGIGVVPERITVEQAQDARDVFGHEILVWDNYPVNDYAAGRLLLAPYSGRENGLSEPLAGIVSNPMNQAAMSEIALSSFGDFGWNDGAYDENRSWEAALLEVAGGDPVVAEALRTFADLNWYDGTLHRDRSPELSQHLAAFWETWRAGDWEDAVETLRSVLARYEDAPGIVRAGVANERFVAEATAWLDAAELWMQAGEAALDVLEAQRHGDGDAAWAARLVMEDLVAQARAIRPDKAPHSSTFPRIADGVIDVFIDEVRAANDRWLAVGEGGPQAITSLPTWADNVPSRMVDGDPDTFFWSSRAPQVGDYVGVDLGRPRPVGEVAVLMGKPTSPNDYIHEGVLEHSVDGTTWHTVTAGSTAEVRAALPDGTETRYIRYRATRDNSPFWLVVREFQVETLDDIPTYTATGEPEPATGSSFAAAVDSDVSSAYVAARAPADGEALTVTASDARPLHKVIVLQSPDSPAEATVQIREPGQGWRDIGTLSGSYTELDAGDVVGEAIRLAWSSGTSAPRLHEIIPVRADTPTAALEVDPSRLELEAGKPGTFRVTLSSTRAADVSGSLDIAVPDEWTADPAHRDVTIPRGESVEMTVTVAAPATGADEVRVTFTTSGAETLESTIPVAVYLPTTDENVALGARATASSVEPTTSFTPDLAVDGDLGTRWSSGYDDASWFQVELAEPTRVGKVVLHWETAYGKAYEIQTSDDGLTWQTVASITDSDGGTDVIHVDATGTFFRMQGVKRATQWGYSLYEFEVYPVE